jgi:glycosyltransferase involved in cell wall biosynthesis
MLLSIITINYNNVSGLQKTVESVLAQTSTKFEYIIVDGASTDGSVEYLNTQYSKLNTQNYKLITEPDTGIYNAMNKGIRLAKGEYIHFLNSGDWLVDEQVVEMMLEEVRSSEFRVSSSELEEKSSANKNAVDIWVGKVISIRPDGKKRYKPYNNTPVSLYTFYRGTIEHTSAYIRRELFNTYGLYDENLRIVSDWKWYLQVAGLNHARVEFANIYVSYFDTSGISSTNQLLDKQERRHVLEELIPAPILADYDAHSFDIEQMKRLKKHPIVYKLVWFIERVFFKFEKWKHKYGKWHS